MNKRKIDKSEKKRSANDNSEKWEALKMDNSEKEETEKGHL